MAPNATSAKATPLPSSHISRTQSEKQLSKDIAAAEWHENCMFDRLVNGIREKQQARRLLRRKTTSNTSSSNTDDRIHVNDASDRRIELSLENIVRHRYKHVPYVPLAENFIDPPLQPFINITNSDEDHLIFDMDDI